MHYNRIKSETLSNCLQRKMLDRLMAMIASVLGARTPLAVVALEAMSLLLEVLGEIPQKQVDLLSAPVITKLTSDSSCLRLQVLPLTPQKRFKSTIVVVPNLLVLSLSAD